MSSWDRPSGWNSSPVMRMPTQKSSPTSARTALSTSMPNLMRFSKLPPHSSVRLLTAATRTGRSCAGARRTARRRPGAGLGPAGGLGEVADPPARSLPARWFLQVARCTGSRMPDGDIRVGQWPPSQRERRPHVGDLDHDLGAVLVHGVGQILGKCGMMRSVDRLTELHQCCGLSMATTEEPPQMARPMPPLAFSS